VDSALIVRAWVEEADSALAGAWSQSALSALAARGVPDSVLGTAGWLVRSDAASTWARWFFESLADLARYVHDDDLTMASLYGQVRSGLAEVYPNAPDDEVRELARTVATSAWRDVQHRRRAQRHRLTPQQREELWFREEPDPRCYLCGYRFGEHAKGRYLRRLSRDEPVRLPYVVDFVRPRGRHGRDLDAEVDHVRPVAGGGSSGNENLRLACGWCNRAKSRYSELYDAAAWSPGTFLHPELGRVSLPQPLWVIRVVGVRGRCEWTSGCTAVLATHELFVAARQPAGALNPLNAAVYCGDHDPWAAVRFVGPSLLG
jgi:hypothetical protein